MGKWQSLNSDLSHWDSLTCTFQDILLLLTAFKIKWRFHNIICEAHYDFVLVYLSGFIIYYFSLLNIHPSLAILNDVWPGLCFICAYNSLHFITLLASLIIHLSCALLWETLLDTSVFPFCSFSVLPEHSVNSSFITSTSLFCIYLLYVCDFPLDCEFLRAGLPTWLCSSRD